MQRLMKLFMSDQAGNVLVDRLVLGLGIASATLGVAATLLS